MSMLRGLDGHELFLGPSDAGIRRYSPLVVGPHPVGWTIEDTDHGLVYVPLTSVFMETDAVCSSVI